MRTRWDRVNGKNEFFICRCNSLLILYMYHMKVSMRTKISWKYNFSNVDFSSWEGWKVDSMLRIHQIDPKWHLWYSYPTHIGCIILMRYKKSLFYIKCEMAFMEKLYILYSPLTFDLINFHLKVVSL